MSSLQIKRIPDDMHAELRRRAELAGMTVRDYVFGLIQRDLRLPPLDELRVSIRSLEPVELAEDSLELLHEERAAREVDLADDGRPFRRDE